MKNSVLTVLITIACLGAKAQNTFPTEGNVGIGILNPQSLLDVRGDLFISSGKAENHIYWGRHHMTMGTKPGDYAHNVLRLKPGGAQQGHLFSVLEMYKANSETDHELKVQIHSTGNTFFNGGNVGIGTSSPGSKLDVRGDLFISSGKVENHIYWGRHHMTMGTKPGDYAHNVLRLKPGGAQQGHLFSVLEMYKANSETDHELKVQIHSTGNSFINGGNVGIGTSSPGSKLDVRGDLYINSGNDDNHIYWGQHYMTMGTKPGDYAHNVLRLKPGGASQGHLVSVLEMYKANSETEHELKVQIHSTGNSFINGGNVGIGTTSPDAKLTVAGQVKCREVKVTVDAGADFVFEDDYQLKEIEEVEAFIKENKHLPEIAPAYEMETEGMNVSEMNIKLLQKIEELTLYLIEQNERLNKVETENRNLEKKIGQLGSN